MPCCMPRMTPSEALESCPVMARFLSLAMHHGRWLEALSSVWSFCNAPPADTWDALAGADLRSSGLEDADRRRCTEEWLVGVSW